MNRGYDWRLGKVRSIATDGKVIYDTALSMFRLSDAFEHTYDPLLNTIGTLLNQTTAPSIYDIAVSLIGDTGFTIGATVNPGGAETTVTIEYGLTNAYGSTQATVTGSPVTETGAISAAITGLTPYTTYHYRIKAVNSAGTTYSDDATLQTLEPAVISDANTVAWYDFATGITKDGSNFVSAWNSRVGANHMAQAVGTNQPLLTANGVLFDGIDNFMSTANFTLNQPITYYMVVRQITWTETDYLISGKSDNGATAIRQAVSTPGISVLSSNLVANSTNLALNTFGYVRAIINRSSSKLQVNAVNVDGSGDVGTKNAGGLNLAKIGVAALHFGNVEYKELIVRDKADNSTDEAFIYNYLKTKYGI